MVGLTILDCLIDLSINPFFCKPAESMDKVNDKHNELKKDGFRILRGPRKTGDGYWEFETLDPDNNRIEVSVLCTK